MKLHLSARQSRILAVALLLLTVAAAAAAVALPTWLLHQRYDAALEDYTDRLQRYRRLAVLRPAIDEATRAVEAGGSTRYYLKGTSAASAAAELQGLVTKMIEDHGGKIASSQMLPAKDDGKSSEPLKAAVTMQMHASTPSLLQILHAIETGQPYLFIDKLTVRATQGRAYKPVQGVEPEFIVQLTVSGFSPAGGIKP